MKGMVAAAIVAAALLAGCASVTDGRPVASPGGASEPTVPSVRPTPSTRPTATPPIPGTTRPSPAPAAEPLPPTDGYVFVETRSGLTRCQLSVGSVDCEAPFTDSPMVEGGRANGVSVTPDGALRWVLGNLGAIPTVTLDYRTYSAVGWTIEAGADGTRFTHEQTGHGMDVAVQGVQAF